MSLLSFNSSFLSSYDPTGLSHDLRKYLLFRLTDRITSEVRKYVAVLRPR